MCGIVGYLGNQNAEKYLIEGLKRLEYRGYDSSGIALLDRSNQYTVKSLGRVKDLEDKFSSDYSFNKGIAHTRWATHGAVNEQNAHPHTSHDGRFIVVHNGVIDNYKDIEADYLSHIVKHTETDTETIANLLSINVRRYDYLDALKETFSILEGSFALVILDQENPDKLILAKNKSPLIIGKNHDQVMIASDVLALAGFVEEIHVMDDQTFGWISREDFVFYSQDGSPLTIQFDAFQVDPVLSSRGQYPHYMLKEIFEQPEIIERLVMHAVHEGFDASIKPLFNDATSIEIIAAGTSYHAGLYAKKLIERELNISTHVHVASEFAYYPPTSADNPLFVFISQSGETADLIACLPFIQSIDSSIITLTNVATSRLAKEADVSIDLLAGPEIAVASTKAFTAQIATFALLIDYLKESKVFQKALSDVANEMQRLLDEHDKIKIFIEHFLTTHNAFFIGRGLDYTIALEASLKLKEISYIQSEAFPAGELKHGTIALIEKDTPVITLLTEEKTAKLTRANIEELKARGASSFVISQASIAYKDDQVQIKHIHPLLDALVAIIPSQLIAYYAALQRGHDIDKPRNLAKSVTVE